MFSCLLRCSLGNVKSALAVDVWKAPDHRLAAELQLSACHTSEPRPGLVCLLSRPTVARQIILRVFSTAPPSFTPLPRVRAAVMRHLLNTGNLGLEMFPAFTICLMGYWIFSILPTLKSWKLYSGAQRNTRQFLQQGKAGVATSWLERTHFLIVIVQTFLSKPCVYLHCFPKQEFFVLI